MTCIHARTVRNAIGTETGLYCEHYDCCLPIGVCAMCSAGVETATAHPPLSQHPRAKTRKRPLVQGEAGWLTDLGIPVPKR